MMTAAGIIAFPGMERMQRWGGDYFDFGRKVRQRVLQWVGIPCGVGFAKSKTLAKIANHIGKKRPTKVFVMPDDSTLDAINAKYGRGTIFHLSEGTKKPWQMRRDMLTPNYTTSWSQIPVVR